MDGARAVPGEGAAGPSGKEGTRAAGQPGLQLHLFGPPRLGVHGEARHLGPRKAAALLAYLAVEREAHTRDRLAALLWPETAPAQARSNLRNLLWLLGKAAPGALSLQRDAVGVEPALAVDVSAFLENLQGCASHRHADAGCRSCEERLGAAVALYRDAFMAGFSLPDSAEFDDWQAQRAEELESRALQALSGLAGIYLQRGELPRALPLLQRRVRLDPLDEEAQRQLIELYLRLGQRQLALRQSQALEELLLRELGVAPRAATRELFERIADGHPGEPHGSQLVAAPAAHPGAGELVGRDAELRRALELYHGPLPGGHWLVIEGEAGVGKTRLADELLRQAAQDGARTLAMRCYQGQEHLAYAPFVDGFQAALAAEDGPERLATVPPMLRRAAARLLPGLPDEDGWAGEVTEDDPGAQRRFFEGLLQLLLAVCAGKAPGVVLLDDLQWADSASGALLAYVLRRLEGRPLLVVATWREELLEASHPLRALLAEAQRAGRASVLRLERLGEAAVAQLVSSRGLPDELARELYRETEGLPLLLVEYLRAAANGSAASELPRGARDLLAARLAAAPQGSRPLLAALATVGRPCDLELLARATGLTLEEAVAAVEPLLALGLLLEEGDEEAVLYRFSHDKLRLLAYQEQSAARRRLLHGAVARAMAESTAGAAAPAAQLAHHYRLAGDRSRAADWFGRAGNHARTLHAHDEALGHFRTALQLGHPGRAGLLEAMGDLLTLQGRYGEALERYRDSAREATGEAPALKHKTGNVHALLGEWDAAEAAFADALPGLAPGERSALLADWSLLAHRRSQTQRAAELAQAALADAETAGSSSGLARAHNLLGILARTSGEIDDAERNFSASLQACRRLGDPFGEAAALNNLALLLGAAGRHDEALELALRSLELCRTLGDRHREAALHSNIADLLHAASRSAEAMEHLKASARLYAVMAEEAQEWRPGLWMLSEW